MQTLYCTWFTIFSDMILNNSNLLDMFFVLIWTGAQILQIILVIV